MKIREVTSPLVEEARRLEAVAAAAQAAEAGSDGLQRLVALVGELLGYPEARLNLVMETVQVTVAAHGAPVGTEAPRELAFCARTMLDPTTVVVAGDLESDERFRDNPYVGADLKAYIGAPLTSRDGSPLGALCVTDRVARDVSPEDVRTLRMLADAVSEELEQSHALVLIAQVTAALARATDLDDVHARICAAATSVAGADGGVLLVRDGDLLRTVAANVELPEIREIPIGPGSLSGRVCLSGRAEFHARTATVPAISRGSMDRVGAQAISALPVGPAGPEGAAGVLLVFWRDATEQVPPHAQRTLTVLADEAAVALERGTLLARLAEMSRIDPLTGLSNRRMLEEVLDREVARAARTGDPLAIAMLDFDDFEAYGDAHGLAAGDALLRDATAAWRNVVRRTDVVARYGGEQFAIVLPACGPQDAVALLERVRAVVPGGQTCSVGCATWDGVETPAALLARADRALHGAKRAGRDRVVLDDETDAERRASASAVRS